MTEKNPTDPSNEAAVPLITVAEGAEVTLLDVRGGSLMTHRLAEMGLTPGVRLRVVSRGDRGPCIVNVKDSRLMLGRGMIERIFVSRPLDGR